MFYWPSLELTDYERQFVSYYRAAKPTPVRGADGKPLRKANGDILMRRREGVLRRTYQVTLNTLAQAQLGLPALHLSDQVQITRRSRIFGLTITGDPAAWRVDINTSAGERYTPRGAQGTAPPLVSAMFPGAHWNAAAAIGAPPDTVEILGNSDPATQRWQANMLIDPNWELQPNETLVFEGQLDTGLDPADPYYLSIAVHAFEFPGMVQGEQAAAADTARRAG